MRYNAPTNAVNCVMSNMHVCYTQTTQSSDWSKWCWALRHYLTSLLLLWPIFDSDGPTNGLSIYPLPTWLVIYNQYQCIDPVFCVCRCTTVRRGTGRWRDPRPCRRRLTCVPTSSSRNFSPTTSRPTSTTTSVYKVRLGSIKNLLLDCVLILSVYTQREVWKFCEPRYHKK